MSFKCYEYVCARQMKSHPVMCAAYKLLTVIHDELSLDGRPSSVIPEMISVWRDEKKRTRELGISRLVFEQSWTQLSNLIQC